MGEIHCCLPQTPCGGAEQAQLPRELPFYFLCNPGHDSGFGHLHRAALILAAVLFSENTTQKDMVDLKFRWNQC